MLRQPDGNRSNRGARKHRNTKAAVMLRAGVVTATQQADSTGPLLERYEPFILRQSTTSSSSSASEPMNATLLRDMLSKSAMDTAINVSFTSGSTGPTGAQQVEFRGDVVGRTFVNMTLKQFLDFCASTNYNQQNEAAVGRNFYLSQATIFASDSSSDKVEIDGLYDSLAAHPSSASTHELIAVAERTGSSLHQANLWLNTHYETVSALHYDEYHNFLHVYSGKKTVILLSPHYTPLLQAFPVYKESCNRSSLGKKQLLELFETIPSSDAGSSSSQGVGLGYGVFEVEVSAGEVLFIPEGYWHLVTSEPRTLAVNYWLLSPLRRLLDRAAPTGALESYLMRSCCGSLAVSRIERQAQQQSSSKRRRTDWNAVFGDWLHGKSVNTFEEYFFSIPYDELDEILLTHILREQNSGNAVVLSNLIRQLSPLGCHMFLCLLDNESLSAASGRKLMRLLNDCDVVGVGSGGAGGREGITRLLVEGRERYFAAVCREEAESVLFGGGGKVTVEETN